MGMVGRIHELLDDVNPAHGPAVRQVRPYASFYGAVKALHDRRLLVALTSKVLDVIALHQRSEWRVKKFLSLVGLESSRVTWCCRLKNLAERLSDGGGIFRFHWRYPDVL